MPPAAVEIGSPIENFSSFRDFATFVQESCNSRDQRSMDPSSLSSAGMDNGSNFGFGAGSGPRAKNRARPRLVKLRKHGGKVRGADPGETGSGFNPFASSGGVQVNKVDDRNGELSGNGCFVFGANGRCCAESTSSNNAQKNSLYSDAVSDKDKCSRPIGDSYFSSEFRKEHSDGDLSKPRCRNQENNKACGENGFSAAETTLRSESGDNGSRKNGTFVFDSSSKNSDNVEENARGCKDSTKIPDSELCTDTCGKFYCTQTEDEKATDYSQVPVSDLHDGMKKLNISDAEKPNEANNRPAFVFGSFGNANVDNNEANTPSGSCSFGSNGFYPNDDDAVEGQHDSHAENNNGNFSTNTTFGTSVSSNTFKVPQWDPSSLKNSLFPETSKTPVVIGKNRLSKQKRSKKIREKLKQSKQNLPQDLASDAIHSQEKINSPGYCSPMDFSPYDDSKASSQFPTEAPSTSSKLSNVGVQENSGFSNDVNTALARDAFTFSTEDRGNNSMPAFSFCPGLGDEKGFTFSVSTSHGKVPLTKRQTQKKFRRKVNKNLLKNDPTVQSKQETRSESEVQAKQDPGSTSAMPDACEMWRLRGNQAYRTGDLHKAEDCYTQGIKSIPPSGSSESSVKSLALCYGNRAAARISLGRLREAIRDCEMAASLDHNFVKAYMRAANCHLVLGELGEAVQYFNKCLETASSVCLDRRTTIEAAEGLQKAQRVTDSTNSATKLLEKRTTDAASEALGPIADALSISSCSEKLLRMKAEALFMAQQYKQVIELCEHTLHIVEMNTASAGSMDCLTSPGNMRSNHRSPTTVWGLNLISKSHFCMGNLETALDKLQKLQQVESSCDKNREGVFDSSACLTSTISELLRFKNAGNEAVRAGRYSEAIEHYTAALSRSVESRPFAAICFCNRAAANQALVHITDAIADCSLAMALDANYTKAIFRRATLNEMIRDYDQAASDLRRIIDILGKKCDKEAKSSEKSAGSASSMKELKQARQRLTAMEEELKKGIPLDFFLILGVKKSDTATDIKKAYRKAALRHHPDKILVRGESEGQWLKEIIHEVHKDADRLFKIIGEAYSVLSDPTKRSEYEAEEEMRKVRASREGNRSRGNRKPDFSYERSPNRRNWRDSRRNYGNVPEWW
ncbi:PREDICTED: uncharacterized protein LOC104817287 isoform X2 [Tarenaya hassleriana]|uniref:uncharacterized protein LOC104817287 isoform X2 n=1 Tax=Tarenaya hassleriana TaxID=28532 RepID=UPI00053C183D|nr:PREDICTED: uncharacterized protein LOC104817287 isoform X2 [Tarenaya hassleriana]